jgi:hypothetical protein
MLLGMMVDADGADCGGGADTVLLLDFFLITFAEPSRRPFNAATDDSVVVVVSTVL